MDYLKFCKENIGRVVRIKWAYSFREDEEHESLVRICKDTSSIIDFGHPYNTKLKRCTCGGMTLRNEDIHALYLVDENQFLTWKRNYLKFHDAVVEEEGSDWCVEKGKMWY